MGELDKAMKQDIQQNRLNPLDEPETKRIFFATDLLLVLVLAAAIYLRFIGMNWDANQHLHPDERFLTMVSTAIEPVKSVSEYFNTAQSSLNPNNRGYGFYVYGTLPLFIVRYLADALNQTGYDQIFLVGRYVSAFFDLLTTFLVYLAAQRLYRKPLVSVLAAAFYGFAVLPIQLSHYFTVDSLYGFFGFLTLYCAIILTTQIPPSLKPALLPQTPITGDEDLTPEAEQKDQPVSILASLNRQWISVVPYVFFGAALGMAMASKVSAFLLAVTLPVAGFVFWNRTAKEERDAWFGIICRNLVIGALVAFLFFRIFQPYAFEGPGFFGISPNPSWISSMRELGTQSTGDVDFPPALQWARRPITFAWQNMVKWGFGLPLGLLAWAGFAWMGWRIFKGSWKQHLVLWSWTLFFFLWWEINFTRSMRYQMLVYPTLAMIAAWSLGALWDKAHSHARRKLPRWWASAAVVVLGLAVVASTGAWAYAFTRIYTRPMTRVAASQWIYHNIPSALNVQIDTGNGMVSQPVSYPAGYELMGGQEWILAYSPQFTATVSQISFAHVMELAQTGTPKQLHVTIVSDLQSRSALTAGDLTDIFAAEGGRGNLARVDLPPVMLTEGKPYYIILRTDDDAVLRFSGPAALRLDAGGGALDVQLPEPVAALRDGITSTLTLSPFTALQSGTVREIFVPHIVDWEAAPGDKTLTLSLSEHGFGADAMMASAALTSNFSAGSDVRGDGYTFTFSEPVALSAGTQYYLWLSKADGPGALALYGTRTAIESTWDDPLPLPMDGYSPFDVNGGLYRTDLNFEMYWDDNADKLARFTSILNQADVIFITSNRQWGTTTRVPERYPLTTFYYRSLMGCPEEEPVFNCYADAKPGMFSGDLGFDLVATFESNPTLGPLEFNTQYAEEAFTVYDHPKVLIFQKRADYDPQQVGKLLGSVNLASVVHITPRKAKSYPGNLLMPEEMAAIQQSGGTWAELFDTSALQNLYPGLGLAVWYLVITLLGWVGYPFVRFALRGLPDHGYPFVKLAGMLLLAFLVWIAGSFGIPFSVSNITLIAFIILAVNLGLGYLQRDELVREWHERRRYFLMVELAALTFFALDLMIRLGNPDLWHPYKGGEKPMDFSYFNAVLKSTVFPPYDPWFAGGYINYYYFGFVLAAVPVKWLGIVPAIAYNLILPTFFTLLALGAFSFGWNILSAGWNNNGGVRNISAKLRIVSKPFAGGLVSAVALVVLGNWGTVRMFWHGMMRLASPNGTLDGATFLNRLAWTVKGFAQLLGGARLPFPPGDWYWIPSRVYPKTEITEFPFFTFLYADPHAHLFALALTLLALGWAMSILLGRWRWGDETGRYAWLHFGLSIFLGGMVIGALRPVNTWDLPTYLVLGCAAIIYTVLRYADSLPGGYYNLPLKGRKAINAIAGVLLLTGLTFLLYAPYAQWYAQGYNDIDIWKGDRSPFWSYLTHWGVFLFVIVSWMSWETREWMATTPVSALRKLQPYRGVIYGGLALLLIALAGLTFFKVTIGWVALPVAAWAAILLLRPGVSDARRAVLFMVGSALVLTLLVEVVVLVGDIERMNTVFKFYLQAWTLLSLSAAAALLWLIDDIKQWHPNIRAAWQGALAVLVFGALLFPVMAGMDKIRDRMSVEAPHTLDGMAYMPYSTYDENGTTMQLAQDYLAIRWMQEHVQGSPVIVEGNVPEYRWGSRYTIYTGLPGVVGWNWHQRQQRAITPGEWVFNRVDAITKFYSTTDVQEALGFLRQYHVKYIIVGQMEKAIYPADGLAKFVTENGTLWKQVYQQADTSIYEVIE